ncbi:uncharacterized protein EAF01_002768 [Botrytis porri]|uniref:uncharacterized protein n=1 Tax=Botrytis porri TaxID=87229 RepID=UPI001900354D|nr:uncharacterized protein EAF01_002768 [Botrytis porri]KAF7911261.1 hypothetical protein EAF01_002768 [Botrytis porri]
MFLRLSVVMGVFGVLGDNPCRYCIIPDPPQSTSVSGCLFEICPKEVNSTLPSVARIGSIAYHLLFVMKAVGILRLSWAALVTQRNLAFGIQYHEVGVDVLSGMHVVDLLTTRVL